MTELLYIYPYSPTWVSRDKFLLEKAMAILSACQMVEIFGGMGTWNDPPPHDGNHEEYKKVSNELYLAMNEGFVVATNSSYKS